MQTLPCLRSPGTEDGVALEIVVSRAEFRAQQNSVASLDTLSPTSFSLTSTSIPPFPSHTSPLAFP